MADAGLCGFVSTPSGLAVDILLLVRSRTSTSHHVLDRRAAVLLRGAPVGHTLSASLPCLDPLTGPSPCSLYVKSLYKRSLVNSLNWYIRRDLWRDKAIEIRAEFDRHR